MPDPSETKASPSTAESFPPSVRTGRRHLLAVLILYAAINVAFVTFYVVNNQPEDIVRILTRFLIFFALWLPTYKGIRWTKFVLGSFFVLGLIACALILSRGSVAVGLAGMALVAYPGWVFLFSESVSSVSEHRTGSK